MPIPSVGRVVHYVSYGTPGGEYSQQCRAATITEVSANLSDVGLAVHNPTGTFFHPLAIGGCPYSEGDPERLDDGAGRYPGGSWHWPEKVDG